jgi:hypothetical protein
MVGAIGAGMWSGRDLALPVGIALLVLALNVVVAFKMAPTNDERDHINYGAQVLRGSADRSYYAYDSKMPVTALNALSARAAGFLRSHGLRARTADEHGEIRASRLATVLVAFLLCLVVYLFGKSLYGRPAGLAAEVLFALSPNITAHSALSTSDLYAAAGFVFALYGLHRFLRQPTAPNAALAAAAMALAQLTKFVALCLYPSIAAVFVAVALSRKHRVHIGKRPVIQFVAFHVMFFLAFVNAAFLFDRTLTPLDRYQFRSATFQALQRIPVVRRVPIPAPYPYIQGLDQTSYSNQVGDGNMMLLGELRGTTQPVKHGFPAYYLVCYALKEPIAMQLLLLLAVVWIARNRRLPDLITGEFPLLISSGLLILWLSLFSRTQIGIRHILPALTAFAILSGAAFSKWPELGLRRKLVLCACLLYAAISVGSYFPHLIPYFNEFVADRKMAYRFLADSNLDWGQNNWVIEEFLSRNRDVYWNPEKPISGRLLVSANFLAGIGPEGPEYWVRRTGLRPVGDVGYGDLLFVVPESVLDTLERGSMTITGTAGSNHSLSVTVSDTNEIARTTILNVLINDSLAPQNACYVAYLAKSKTLVLVDDAGHSAGPFAGSMNLNTPSGGMRNSQCAIRSASTHSEGRTLTLTLNLAFEPGFHGTRIAYAAALDDLGRNSGWQPVMRWSVQ